MDAKPPMNEGAHIVLRMVAWVAAGLASIVLSFALIYAALFLIYPYNLPVTIADLHEIPELSDYEVVGMTSGNARLREPVGTLAQFLDTDRTMGGGREYALVSNAAGNLYVVGIEACPLLARWRVAGASKTPVSGVGEECLRIDKPLLSHDEVTVRDGKQIALTRNGHTIVNDGSVRLIVVGIVAIALFMGGYQIAHRVRRRKHRADGETDGSTEQRA